MPGVDGIGMCPVDVLSLMVVISGYILWGLQ